MRLVMLNPFEVRDASEPTKAGVPVWVRDVVKRASMDFGAGIMPRIIWRHGRHPQSSGHCNYTGRIVVTAGTDRADSRLVLLHEMAHYLTGSRLDRHAGKSVHHGDAFYRKLFELVRWDGHLTWKVVLTREGRYKAQAITTAKALGIRGAGTIGRQARKARVARRPRRGWCPVPLGRCWASRAPDRRHTHYLGTVINVVVPDAVSMPFTTHHSEQFVVNEPVRHPMAVA